MIVCNEEKNLKRCLKSVKGFADEIIAVDTGSTDSTKSILEEYGAKVFDYVWKDDFSVARNYNISKSSGDFILFLDADEKAEISKPSALKDYLNKTEYDLIPMRMVHFYGKRPADTRHAHFSCGLRLVRNNSIRFFGKIHEKIDIAGKRIDPTNTAQQHIRILHYGYMNNAYKKKKDRNLMILRGSDIAQDDPWTHYYLAAEYFRQGKINAAYKEINSSIILFLSRGLKPPSLVYKLKYNLLILAHNYPDAYNGIGKAITLYPDYVDLHFYKGILQYARGEYEIAKKTFSYCLILGETNLEYLIFSGSGSFLAMYYLGLCCQKLGQSDEAIDAFRQTEKLHSWISSDSEFEPYLPK